jgi:hypothetical protein
MWALRMSKYLVLALLIIGALITPAWAFCSRPIAPYCASGHHKFDDQHEFDQCKREIENYRSEIDDYVACVKKQSLEAIDEYNEMIKSLNRRARK